MLYAILIYGSDADEPTGAGRYAAAAKNRTIQHLIKYRND